MYSKQIEEFCEQFARFIMSDMPPDWPISYIEGCWYIHHTFIKDLYLILEEAKKKFSEVEISTMFKNPSRIMHYLFWFGYPFSSLSVFQKTQLVTNLLQFVSHYRKSDIYCSNGRNIIWENERLKRELLSSIWFRAQNKDFGSLKRILSIIRTTLALYCEAIYPLCHPACHEIHGYYELTDDAIILVREYYDLCPEVWNLALSSCIDSVIIIEEYGRINMSIDIINAHRAVTMNSLADNLHGFSIRVNGEHIGEPLKVSKVLNFLLEMANKINKITLNYSRENWIRKIIEVNYYQLKPIRDMLSENWEPSEEILGISSEPVPDDFISYYEQIRDFYLMPEDKAFSSLVGFLKKEYVGDSHDC